MRVDDYTWLPQGANRNSVRITSKETFGIGSLIVLDAVKMPYGPSVWPAFWRYVPPAVAFSGIEYQLTLFVIFFLWY